MSPDPSKSIQSQAPHGGNLLAAAARFGREPASFIDFSSNINVWLPPWRPDAEALRQAVVRYPESDGHGLRRRLASLHAVDETHLLPAAGAIEALYLALRLFAGKRIGIVEPAFSDYRRAALAADAKPEAILLAPDEWSLPADAYAERFAPFDAVVLGTPNSPTGTRQTKETLLALAARHPEKAWIVDEAFLEFDGDYEKQTLLHELSRNDRLVVIGSLTKSWGIPGLRLGFAATANKAWMAQLSRWQAPWSLNGVAQLWAGENLDGNGLARMRASLADLPRVREAFLARLRAIPQLKVHPSHANFLLIELLSGAASEVEDALGRDGLLVRLCDSFHGMPPGRFLRVAVRREEENERLAAALADLLHREPSPA